MTEAIAVLDIGMTNKKVVLYSNELALIGEILVASLRSLVYLDVFLVHSFLREGRLYDRSDCGARYRNDK